MARYTNATYDPVAESNKLRKLRDKYAWALDAVDNLRVKKAAVLIAIFQFRGRPHVILTERSRNLRVHAGDVALPGGKVDEDDESVAATALREAEEEIGLMRKHIEVIGSTMPVYSTVAKVLIVPVIGFIRDIENVHLTISHHEVESVFAVPLQVFSEILDYTTFGKTRFPKVEWKSTEYLQVLGSLENEPAVIRMLFHGRKNYRVWGITAVILDMYSSMVFHRRPFMLMNDDGPLKVMGKYMEEMLKTYAKSKM